MSPSITIIIPAYNRATVITRALDSLLQQSFQGWECIIVDDHSTDDTREVILDYCQKDKRFHYLLNSRKKGAQGARNTGLYKAESDWVMFFDSDNAMYPECLQTLMEGITPDYDVIKCFSHIVDSTTWETIEIENGIAEGNIHQALFDGVIYIDFNHIIIRKNKILEIGGLDEECPALQEFDTNIRLSTTARYHTVQKVLIYYCFGGSDTIFLNNRKQARGKYYSLKKHKSEWLTNKQNADRMIFEFVQRLNAVDSLNFKLLYYVKLAFLVPEMLPYYLAKKVCHRN